MGNRILLKKCLKSRRDSGIYLIKKYTDAAVISIGFLFSIFYFIMLSYRPLATGEDGPSQMALEDLGMFRSVPGCVVFYPSDAVSCERAVELAANHPDMVYIRSSRPATATLYSPDEKFEVGKAKVK